MAVEEKPGLMCEEHHVNLHHAQLMNSETQHDLQLQPPQSPSCLKDVSISIRQ
jgi:hypothetical protein